MHYLWRRVYVYSQKKQHEWIKKIWYMYISMYVCICLCVCTHTIKYFSAIKKNEIISFAEKWMELKIITLIEIRQIQKTSLLICRRL
jgi:hypothetical protein